MAAEKKNVRTKRSRLGRGLSALVEVPAVEVAGPEGGAGSKSDNLDAAPSDPLSAIGEHSPNSESSKLGGARRVVGDGGGRGLAVGRGAGGGDGSGVVDGFASGGGLVVHAEAAGGVVEVAVGLIVANKDQPRRVFDEGALAGLSGSIKEHGLMQPVVVRRVDGGGVGDGSEDQYELIAGERRWRASQMAGLETIPAIVREVDDLTSAQLALIENVQREDLNVVELAEGYRVLSERYSMTQERIAKTVGVSRSSVANIVRLLDLPDEVRALISSGALSSGHGKVLLSLGAPEKQRRFAARCLKEDWNVRTLQEACNAELDGEGDGADESEGGSSKIGINPVNERANSVLRDLERRIGEELGTRVKIRTDKSRTRGRMVVEFYDLDQFDGLLARLGVKSEG